jgi:AcrR family transcriptional regulator
MSSSPDASLSRRERERRMRRRAMLDAARAVFAEKGYAHATLDEIAERAEFGKGTLYNYFEGGKEGLLFAVFEDVFREIEDLIRTVFHEEAGRDQSLREAFHTFAERHFETIRDQQDLFLILVKEGHLMAFSDDAERTQFFQEQHQRLVDALTSALESAIEDGEIQRLPAAPVAHLLLANVRGMGIQSILNERNGHCEGSGPKHALVDDPKRAADFLTTLLFDGLETEGALSSSA